MLISSGDLTLDAQGDANAVFIFQMGSTLTTTAGRQVILSGGAQAANIVWQVGSSATLGTTSVMKGNILALTSITVTTGAAVEGRLLARNGAVTLDANTVGLGTPGDTTPPTVSSTDPANAATAVAINKRITATFSEAMDPLTISTTTFTLEQGATAVSGTVTYVGTTATFAPASALAINTPYTVTITTGVKDLAGNPLLNNLAWSFTTAATTAGQGPVVLGSASTFAVLAGSTVTSTGGSMVNGDLGVSPGTAVTGFLPGVVNGALHVGDAIAAQAQLDLTSAYNDAAGRTVGAITLAGNLGGQTLTPGLYKSTSSLEISSGDLTLDAQGDANAVFIFQMGSTLTTTSGRQVILSGGARAANIFWQVGSSATLGTTSVMKGNILALASITLTTGATLEGRALARTAAVTLDANTIGLGTPADTTRPTVSSTDPANAATAVAINKRIAATFSEAMDPATISAANFTLRQGATPVAGTVTYVGTTATFAPASALAINTTYTVTITTGVKDLAG
ncbi:MAG TPA: ice-binding family protein, partial [Verrucomicrobiae bacterium]|nr:ice-binding family protein [Verrucomicrobiae bacterium]